MNEIEARLELILKALREIASKLDPGNAPGIASDLSEKLAAISERLDKIEKKLEISN